MTRSRRYQNDVPFEYGEGPEECRHSVEEALLKVKGVLEVYADLRASEVEVIARKGEVTARLLVETINKTQDSEHSLQAKLIRGPEPVE